MGWLERVPEAYARPRGEVRSRVGGGVSIQGSPYQTYGRGVRTSRIHERRLGRKGRPRRRAQESLRPEQRNLPSGPEVPATPRPRRSAPPEHDEVRRILCEFVLVRLQNLSNQARLGFDICSMGTQKDDTQRPVSVEECQVAEVLVLRQQDPVLRAGPREHLIVAYASGDLGDVGYVVAFAPQTRNDLPLHTLVGGGFL